MSRQLPVFSQIRLSGPLRRLVRQTALVSIGLLLLPIAAHAQAGDQFAGEVHGCK